MPRVIEISNGKRLVIEDSENSSNILNPWDWPVAEYEAHKVEILEKVRGGAPITALGSSPYFTPDTAA